MAEEVVLIYGGPGGEHRVSRVSALGIWRHMDRGRWNPLCLGVTEKGEWYLQNEPGENDELMPLTADENRLVWAVPGRGLRTAQGPITAKKALVIIHGTYGEDGRIQGLLDWAGIRYAGSGVMGSALGMDKDLVKRVWRDAGLPVVDWRVVRSTQKSEEQHAVIKEALELWGWPLFVKPANSGSSVGVSKAGTLEELGRALEGAFKVDKKVLLEPALEVREVECAVLQTRGEIQTFAPGEIVPTHEFYDYEAKYTDPDGAKLRIPADIDTGISNHVQEIARKAFTSSEAGGFARVDFFIDRKTQKIYLNEINTLPGFTPISMYPKMAEAGGIGYTELINRLLEES